MQFAEKLKLHEVRGTGFISYCHIDWGIFEVEIVMTQSD
jgi:hypothetical protein